METPRETGDARSFFPSAITIETLREAARSCTACPLWRTGTQIVFGEGPARARILLVGDAPGDDEDREGRPFVGPGGRLLDRALADAGIAREDAYLTTAVKHFPWGARGKRHLPRKPSAGEVKACLPWLEKEIELVAPEMIVLLGATAAQAIHGRAFRVTKRRGEVVPTHLGPPSVATVNPSSILRKPTAAARRTEYERLVANLRAVATLLAASRPRERRRAPAPPERRAPRGR